MHNNTPIFLNWVTMQCPRKKLRILTLWWLRGGGGASGAPNGFPGKMFFGGIGLLALSTS